MNSLLGRILLWSLGAVVIGAAASGWWMYRNLLAQTDAFFDRQLRETALALRHQAFEFAVVPELAEPQAGYDFVVQVWTLNGLRVYQSQPRTVLPGITQLGLSTVDTSEGRWRVFGVPARGFVIQVAQPMSVRQREAARLALGTLFPFLALVPVLVVLISIAVAHSVRPLRQVAERVRARHATALDPIPETPLPEEIRPLAAAMNDLLARLSAARQREQAFLGDAAHELRTPLTALRLQLEALLGATDENERRRSAQALSAGLDRAGRLVEQLLTLSRQDSARAAQMQPVALDALARDVIQELIPLADARRIDLGLAQSSPIEVNGDADALRALLRNLVDNAIRYTPQDGRVDVAVLEDAGHPVLRVCDTGRGIAPEERERVFERFYRLAGSEGVGSGLGLAIVRKIAQAHDAQVTIQDGPQTAGVAQSSRGTCVSVRFAATRAQAQRS